MLIVFEVAIEYFFDGLFCWDFQDSAVVINHVDNSDFS